MLIRVPEDVFRKMGRAADGRCQNDEVTVDVTNDRLVIEFMRTGEKMEWSRTAYNEAIAPEKKEVRRSLV